ncbi:MAG: TonB-dependent receptor [bacterium]|nr:TonB-dependent receptor [bacterium]
MNSGITHSTSKRRLPVFALLLFFSCTFFGASFSFAQLAPDDKEIVKSSGESDEQEELDFYSLESMINAEIVSATKKKQKISEAPAIITVITAQQIKDRGYQTVGEALESVAGMDMLHDHVRFNAGIRGINGGMRGGSKIIKLMIDGQPVSFRSSSENWLGEELIPMNVVERIEIIRGPASALYGANAFLGVINVITKSGEKVQWGEASGKFAYGSKVLSYGGQVMVGGKFAGVDFIASGTINRADQSGNKLVNIPGSTHSSSDTRSEGEIAFPMSYFAKVGYSNDTLGTFGLDFNYQRLDSYGEFMDWAVVTHNNRIHLYNMYARAKYSRNLFKLFDVSASFAYSKGGPANSERFDIDDDDDSWITRDYGFDSIDVTAEARFNLDKWTNFSVGFDLTNDMETIQTFYTHDGSTNTVIQNSGGNAGGKKTFRNIGAYAQAMIYPFRMFKASFMESLGFIGGLRYDTHNIYENVWNWRIGAVYQVTDTIYTKALYGTSFKAPASAQLYTNPITNEGVLGNEDLKPEKAQTVELAAGAQFMKHFSMNLNIFYNNIKQKVELVLPTGTVSNVKAQNVAEINSIGGETDLIFTYKFLFTYVNYSFQKSIVKKQNLILGEVKINTDLFPSHMIKFGANYKIPWLFLNLNVEGKYLTSRLSSEQNAQVWDAVNYRTDRYNIDSYFLLDAMISTHGLSFIGDKETEIRLKVYNIFNTSYAYPGFQDFDIPGFERSFVVSLVQQF